MAAFTVKMKHSAKTLEALSHMQYDLFCRRNRISRLCISAAAVMCGIMNYSKWWGILLVAYGCYLITSTYSSPNRTAHKLTQQIEASGLGFPRSEYVFEDTALHVFSLPKREEVSEPLAYSKVLRMGEDAENYYIFRDQYGGYMVPKQALEDKLTAFRDFMEEKTGQTFYNTRSPLKRFLAAQRRRENEPYRL